MPPSGFRKVLTFIHLLVILSFAIQPVAPLAATAATLAVVDARPLNQEEPPTEDALPPAEPEPEIPYEEGEPAPVIPIPESDNPVDPATPPVEIPLDGIWGEGETPDPGPSPEFLGTTDLPATPVDLNVELDRYVLLPGEQAMLSIGVLQPGEAVDNTVVVTLTLPPQLQIVGDPESTKVWSYDGDTLAVGIYQSFTIAIRDTFTGSNAAVVDIWLETGATGYEAWGKRWVVGIPDTSLPSNGEGLQAQALQASEGAVLYTPELTLLAPASAAPTGVEIQYTPLYTGPVAVDEGDTLTETTSITSEQASTPAQVVEGVEIYLPSLQQDSAFFGTEAATPLSEVWSETEPSTSTVPTLEENGVSVYRLWHLSADGLIAAASNGNTIPDEAQDPEHPEFASAVLMVVDVADLVAQDVDMNLLDLWTRPDESQDWRPVPFARYDEERQSWVAWLDHFSDFALGIAPAANGELLPSMKGHTVDHQTGSANFSYPINAPSGLGGLNPNLSLNYSSQAVNDMYMALGHNNSDDVQASMVGYGWSLGGMNSITKFRDKNNSVYYSMTLNGQSFDIREIAGQVGKYDTDPISFAAIKFTNNSSVSEWQIKTPDGTLYVFGGALPYAPTYAWPSGTVDNNIHTEMHFNVVNGVRTREVTAWHLRHVEDTVGNSIDYTVTTQRGAITDGSCLAPGLSSSDPDDDPYRWYTRSARLSQISYSSNTGKYGASVPARLRIRFEYTTRSDINSTDDCQPRKTGIRLSKIYVEALKTDSSGWHILRHYELVPTYPTGSQSGYLRHLLLQKVHEYGKDGGTTLFNTHTFGYTKLNEVNTNDTEYNIHLSTADNGFGGKVTYTYVDWNVECAGGDAVCQNHKQRLISKMQLEDGQGNYYITTFTYRKPHLRVEAGRLVFMGTDYTTSNVYQPATNPSGTLVLARFEEYRFVKVDQSNPHAAEGKLESMIIRNHSGSGNIPYYEANYKWESFIRNSTQTAWSITTFNWPQPIWTRLARKDEWTGGPAEGFGRQERYSYETNYASTYGNIIQVDEYSHPESNVSVSISEWKSIFDAGLVLLRRTKTQYFPNTSWPANANAPYIVNQPARVIVEDGSGNCQAESRTIYADYTEGTQNRSRAYNITPATALPIKSEQVISGCPHSPTGDRELSSLIVSTYTRDVYGNATHRTSHSGTGNIITIQTLYDPFYVLFPIERWNYATPTIKAKASYYGVNGIAVDSSRGYWGTMRETCEVNNVCSRFGYDQFGRRIHQWDRQVGGSGWPTDAVAAVRWTYRKPGELGTGHKTYIVTEWRAPRCDGNFVRHHYDGLGQLVVEQKSHQDWQTSVDGCTRTAGGYEIVTRFKYDALGNQVEATVPRNYLSTSGTYVYYNPPVDWSIKGQTVRDPLGRVARTIAPNGEQTDTTYNGRITTIVGIGRNGDPNKTLRWNHVNGLGYQRAVRAVYWNTSANDWRYHAELIFTTNVLGNVTQVQHTGVSGSGATYTVGTNTYTYDQAGRMTRMVDMDMGTWDYVYNRRNQLTRQEDGRNINTCLYYDSYGRLWGKHYNGTSSACPTGLASNGDHEVYSYGTSGITTGQLTQISLRVSPGATESYKKTISYNSAGLVDTETVAYPGIPVQYATTYTYDTVSGRLITTRFPPDAVSSNEIVTYGYNGMGLVETIHSSVHGTIADGIGYNELGYLTHITYRVGDDLKFRHSFYPWGAAGNDSDARLKDISVGTSTDFDAKLYLLYNYDSFGNIKQMNESYNGAAQVTHTFENDVYNRLRLSTYSGGTTKLYQAKEDGRPSTYEGQVNNYNNTQPYAVDSFTVGGSTTLAYTRDLNGNVTTREYMNGGNKVTQSLFWNDANLLRWMEVGGQSIESYFYDPNGIRVYKHRTGVVSTFYPFSNYEVEGTTPTRYYMLNGRPIALRIGTGSITYLNHDQVGSVVLTTVNGAVSQQRQYFAYGNKRGGNDFAFEQNYTGQRKDDTGLIYYNARYYDPSLGQFISPDSIIPDPGDYFSYNRYLYARGNPVSNNDPSGHRTCCPTGLPNPLTRILTQAAESFVQSDAVQGGVEAFGFVFCTMTMCDLPEMLQEGHSYVRENYIDPHLPESYLQTEETINTILSDPLMQELLMGSIQMPLPGMGLGDDVLGRLPIRSGGKGPTSGILVIDGVGYPLASGYSGPASQVPLETPGFSGLTRGHVEGHAAAIMRQQSVENATLYINNVPCPGTRGCDALLPTMLPENSQLRIIGPDGFDKTYIGLPD